MSDTEKNNQDIQFALEDLLRLAKRRGIVVCGFAFGTDPPSMINFGTCHDAGDLRLYEALCKFHESNKDRVNHVRVQEVN